MKPQKINKSGLKFGSLSPYRNQKWIEEVRIRACFLTHIHTNDYETVDPAHLGTGGWSQKTHDYEVFPLRHSLHALQHQKGWFAMLEPFLGNWVLFKTLLKAYWYIECLKFVSGMSRRELIDHFGEKK